MQLFYFFYGFYGEKTNQKQRLVSKADRSTSTTTTTTTTTTNTTTTTATTTTTTNNKTSFSCFSARLPGIQLLNTGQIYGVKYYISQEDGMVIQRNYQTQGSALRTQGYYRGSDACMHCMHLQINRQIGRLMHKVVRYVEHTQIVKQVHKIHTQAQILTPLGVSN